MTHRAKPHLHVLVVDDHQPSANALGLLLQRDGHCVKIVYTVTAALDVAQASTLDVVLSDIELDGEDGIALAGRLRDIDHFRASLVAMTGYSDCHTLDRIKNAGFAAHFSKPIDVPALRAYLAEMPGIAAQSPQA